MSERYLDIDLNGSVRVFVKKQEEVKVELDESRLIAGSNYVDVGDYVCASVDIESRKKISSSGRELFSEIEYGKIGFELFEIKSFDRINVKLLHACIYITDRDFEDVCEIREHEVTVTRHELRERFRKIKK